MSALNRRIRENTVTFEGAVTRKENPEKVLNRMVLANMLWENQFYVDGKTTANLVKDLIPKVSPKYVSDLALKARSEYKLRSIPLLLVRELARTGNLKASVLDSVIQRPDEMGEFMSLYWKDKKEPLSNQVKKGLASAFLKFNEYSLAKWDKNSAAISMRDVMFLCHPKPQNAAQEDMFKRLASKELKTPDTWETELSAGADKRETFTRLMAEGKLGALAFLKNLRNMLESGIPESIVRAYANTVNVDRVLPFRYVSAARVAPALEDMLEAMMLRSLAGMEKLKGKTVLLVDISGSMFGAKVSAKSDLDRFDAAVALAMLCREVCEEVEIYTFSTKVVRVPPRSGFALRDAIKNSQRPGGTDLGGALASIVSPHDRMLVFTDGESHTPISSPKAKKAAYIVNVASYNNGVSHGAWTNITGFSESVVTYIGELEKI